MSTTIAWSPELSVGIEVIDKQHKYFINILNSLYTETLAGNKVGNIDKLFNELAKYATFHFSTEERFFEEYKFPGAQEHIAAHKALRDTLTDFANRKEDGEDIILELLDFVENWLVDHLSSMDKKYSKWFNDHGLH